MQKFRTSRNLSHRDLAKSLGVHPAYLQECEHSDTLPASLIKHLEHLLKIEDLEQQLQLLRQAKTREVVVDGQRWGVQPRSVTGGNMYYYAYCWLHGKSYSIFLGKWFDAEAAKDKIRAYLRKNKLNR